VHISLDRQDIDEKVVMYQHPDGTIENYCLYCDELMLVQGCHGICENCGYTFGCGD
jgi:hypothetical protein